MARITVPFNKSGIEKIPEDKPAVYRILTGGGRTSYTGVAMRGRVQEKLREHLWGGKDYIPGTEVQIEQMSTIDEARAKEERIIARTEPPYNRV